MTKEQQKINNAKNRKNRIRWMKEKYKNDPIFREKTKEICRNCDLKSKYGIDVQDYKILFDQQKGLCGCCGKPKLMKQKNLVVDHDHSNGKIRGLLCNHCNLGIGMLGDNVESILNALRYLTKEGA